MGEHRSGAVVFRSTRAEDRLRHAVSFMREQGADAHAWVVVPSRLAGIDLAAQVLARDEARFRMRRLELGALVRLLAQQRLLRAGLSFSGGLSQMALCARAVDELSRARRLGRLSPVAERPGLVRALVGTIDELRVQEVEVAALSEQDADLARVLERYEQLLPELGLVDRAGLFQHAAFAGRAAQVDVVVWLDVPVRSRVERSLLQALVQRARRVLITLPDGDRHTTEQLSELGLEPTASAVRSDANGSLARLSRRLFAVDDDERPAPVEAPLEALDESSVEIFTSPSESREAVEIARRVLAASGHGTPFDRMAIALRAPEAYRSQVEEALARAQIPAFFAEGVKRPDPAGRALHALLECEREGLSARAFAEYLSLGVVPSDAERLRNARLSVQADADDLEDEPDDDGDADDTPLSPRRWERLLVDAAVIGGRARWERRLKSLARAMAQEVQTLEVDDPRRTTLERDAEQLERLSRFALPLLDRLAVLPRGGTWAQWIAHLDALCVQAIRRPTRVRSMLAELWPLGPLGPVGTEDVLRVLGPRLGDVVVKSKGSAAGKVLVCGVDELRGRSLDVVFVPGLSEKIFPPRVLEDALLPDRVRRKLGAGLSVVEDRVAEERLKLRVLVGAAAQKLVLSYPRFDVEHARPRVPSFYGLEVLRALDGQAPSFEALKRRAHPGAAARMGYPAPSTPEEAIDDAELDLAMLARLFEAEPEHKQGAARYLLEASPELSRALRFRARRWSLKRFCHADGLVAESDEVRALLAEHRLSVRPYSATALAQFARCPYSFFLYAVMGLLPREEVRELDELDARQRGIVFHEVQRATLTRLRAEGALPVRAEGLEHALVRMREELSRQAARVREETPPAIDRVLEDMLRVIEGDLAEWLSRMAADPAFVPLRFELGFGLGRTEERDEDSRPDPVRLQNGLLLRGAIDLVEESTVPGERPGPLRATDTKTGAAFEPLAGIIRGGEMLQPLLYALALEALFPAREVLGGRLYFCTSRGGFAEHTVPLHQGSKNLARELFQTIDRALERGFLPAAPKLDACASCAFQAVCGPHEPERVAKKQLEALAPLHHLRNLP